TLGVYIAKKSKSLVWINGVGAAVTVAVSLVLVPRLGLGGAVWAAVACYAVMAEVITRVSQSLYRIDLAWPRLVPLLAWLFAVFAAGAWVQARPETGLALRFGLLAFGLALPFLVGAVGSEERKALRRVLLRK